jgi:hypothetical protein
MLHLRFAVPALLVGAFASVAACSVYDEGLLGAGGEADDSGSTRSSASSDGGSDGDGGAAPGATTGSTSSDASTGTSTAETTGATGTVTTGGGCETVDDCPGDENECATRTCEDGACSVAFELQGVEFSRQERGDCLLQVCDGSGGIEAVDDDTDLPPDDGNDCTEAVCVGGTPDHVPVPERDPCDQGGGQYCDGDGSCVECTESEDCGSDVCTPQGACADAECTDDVLNGEETDTDCGGTECDPCGLGETCELPSDCLSDDCDGTCQPSCTDGVLNNGESGIDCGGLNCSTCGFGLGCQSDDDCAGDFCLANVCRPNLFFSEYVEGTSNNKVLEVFSFTAGPVNLTTAACSVKVYFNGNTTASTTALTGTIDELETHVLCFSGFDPDPEDPDEDISLICDQIGGAAMNFNGDDAIALECGGATLDVIGRIGLDPGSAWTGGGLSTANRTLRRMDTIAEGDRNGGDTFDPSIQWEGFDVDDFTGLGDHI